MPGISRLGDNARVENHTHDEGCCPHTAVGPAISASANVMVNSLPALRLGDIGVHVSCCGPNLWTVIAASGQLFLNGSPAVRLGDATLHCAVTQGEMIEASGDVSDFSPSLGIVVLGPSLPPEQREIYPWVHPECIPGIPTAPDLKPFLWDPAADERRKRAASAEAASSHPHLSANPRTPEQQIYDAERKVKSLEGLGVENGKDEAEAELDRTLEDHEQKKRADISESLKKLFEAILEGGHGYLDQKEVAEKVTIIMEELDEEIANVAPQVQEAEPSENEGRVDEIGE